MNREGTKKKAAPVLQHQGGQDKAGAAALAGTTTPICDSTTDTMTTQAVKVSEFLLQGRINALPLRYLRDLLHVPPRKVRLMIRAERLDGVPILESSHPLDGGYYLPENRGELVRCVQGMRRRADEIIRVADAIEGAAGID